MQVLRDAVSGPHGTHEPTWAPRKAGGGGGAAAARRTTSPLEDRVDDLVVVEFRGRAAAAQQLRLSVRGLYQYVLSAITGGGEGEEADAAAANANRATKYEEEVGGGPRIGGAPALSRAKPGPARARGRKGKKKRAGAPSDGEEIRTKKEERQKTRVTYRDRLGNYLSPRDLRRLAIPVSKRNEPEIIVRRHVICVNMDPLPAIILRDRLLVVVPIGAGIDPAGTPPPNHTDLLIERIREAVADGGYGDGLGASKWLDGGAASRHDPKDEKEVLAPGRSGAPSLLSRLTPILASTAGPGKGEDDDTDDPSDEAQENEKEDELDDDDEEEEEEETNEWKELQRLDWLELPLELQCLDSILSCSLDKLVSETREVHEASRDYIHRLVTAKNNYHRQDPHMIIIAVKDAISEISSRVRGIEKALARMLDDYEDMALMNLSRVLSHPELFIHPVPFAVLEQESDQPELILEAHLQTALSLESTLDLVRNQIESASVLIEQNLDAVRNRLLLANMILTVVTVCIGLASLVGSFMGMNLLNHLEDSGSAFLIVVVATSSASVVAFLAILGFLFYSGTIPVPGLGGG